MRSSWKTRMSFLFLSLSVVLYTQAVKNKSKNSDVGGCFCKLNEQVDDCACQIESLDQLNNKQIHPPLQSLLAKDYFRYFKVNLKKQCPFWPDDSRCALKDCHVSACSEGQVPDGIKAEIHEKNKYSKEAQEEKSQTCQEERELSALDTTISKASQEAFKNWTDYDDSQENFCEIDDDTSADSQYVDLLLNPERYTGYKGASTHRIWRSIYDENCFKPEKGIAYGKQRSLAGLCLEKRAFYRLISGLHTSINIHLCAQYLLPSKTMLGSKTWGPNLEEFKSRFDPKLTNGHGPQRLKNLYFAYLVELRALAKAAPYLEQEDFFTGNDEEDRDVKQGIKNLLSFIKSFPHHFDESKLFQGNPKEAHILKEEFKNHFRNISRIMDCVGCDKCKLWGKLQVQGMGTALKILFSGDGMGPDSTVTNQHKKSFQLRRTEIVSLFNAFGRLSKSIQTIELFREQS
ncbi:hypothetical protein ACJMK2_036043 [Sinanodonta woodiana]|uniref:Uncharacterized protein n=1 Tax=Sinanodonta woodiana TaxID=1069815 RepID=A0ABD3WFY8_SINWO